jgi:zinc protease
MSGAAGATEKEDVMPFPFCARRFFTVLALVSALTPPAAARHAPVLPPVQRVSPPGPIPQIPYEKYTLPNGLQVILHVDRKLPVVHVNVWYHVGSKNEKPGRTGFAHLFEHLMFQGSPHHPGDYLAAVERMGGSNLNGTTSFDRTNYFETVPAGSLERALWLEADRMGFLGDGLTQAKLDNQRDVVKNERRQGMDNAPYGRAFEVIVQNLFPQGHPLSWDVIGSMEDLSAATLEDAKRFFRTYYAPNNASLAIVGNFEPFEAKRSILKYFGPLPPGPPLERPKRWAAALRGERQVVVADRVALSRLYLVWPGAPYFDRDDAPLVMLASILGDGKNSRLYRALVYDRQLASGVSAYHWAMEIAGLFGVEATARPGQTLDELESVIDREVARLALRGPTLAELERAKAKWELNFLTGLERIGGFGGKADRLNEYNTFLGSPDMFGADLLRFRRVSPGDIRRVASRYVARRDRLQVRFVPERSEAPTAAAPDRSKAPEVGGTPPFRVPTVSARPLANGARLMMVERHELPQVVVRLVVRAGAAQDPSGRPGDAWMTAQMLTEGTRTRSALQLSADIDRLGGRVNVWAGLEGSTLEATVRKADMAAALALMADMVQNATFPRDELERQRKLRLDALAQERSDPWPVASRLFRRQLFGARHPYAGPVAGDEASIRALQTTDLRAFYQAGWRPESAAFVVVGDTTPDEAAALIERAFAGWRSASPRPAPKPAAVRPPTTRVLLVDKPGAAQSVIWVGLPGPARRTPDYPALEVVNYALGGAYASRLNLNLRQDKGFSYGYSSWIDYAREGSMWATAGGVQTPSTKAALIEIMRELRGMSKKALGDTELAEVREALVRSYAGRFESLGDVASQVADLFLYDLPRDELARYPAEIEGVTAETARAAAAAYLHPDSLLVVIVGDRKEIEAGVRELNLGSLQVVDADGRPVSSVAAGR